MGGGIGGSIDSGMGFSRGALGWGEQRAVEDLDMFVLHSKRIYKHTRAHTFMDTDTDTRTHAATYKHKHTPQCAHDVSRL
jgi:hypothetical protein